MARAHVLGVLLVVSSLSTAAVARAAVDSDAGVDDGEVSALEKQIDDELGALSMSDCELACRALASIRRAADKICALEPGPRCDAARGKADDATRRVEDACPSCAIAEAPTRASPAPDAPASVAMEQAPPGGCRSCSAIGATSAPDLGLVVVGLLGVARIFGRRSRRR